VSLCDIINSISYCDLLFLLHSHDNQSPLPYNNNDDDSDDVKSVYYRQNCNSPGYILFTVSWYNYTCMYGDIIHVHDPLL